MQEEVKDSTIQIRVSKKLRKLFNNKCHKEKIKPAVWLRNKIEEFIKEDEI